MDGMSIPAEPAIYHITHVDNIAKIVRDGVLWSDAAVAISLRTFRRS
jgi:hypothetical protein